YVYLWNTGANTADLTDVVAGTYEVTVVDANGCKTKQTISLTAPEELVIESEVIINPTCFEGNDGSISVSVVGGTPPYQYEWTNGNNAQLSEGLAAGNHEVIITDSKGCSTSKAFVIENPAQIELNLGDDVTLCQGQAYIIDGRIENGVSYSWSSSNGFTSSDAVIEVTDEGVYKVIAINSDGCEVQDEIEIKRSTEEISANFLMSSQVFTDEVFVVVNVSNPVPDEVDWMLPTEATIKEVNDDFAELSFAEEGEYEITLYTKKGDCEAFLTKKVLVLERDFDDPSNGGDSSVDTSPMIQDLVIYPNPSSGVFALEVTLKEESPISVKIFTLVGNDMIDYKKMENHSEYKIDYNLNLTTGLYFVVLESKGERIVKKIIIH
ncbi:T9SS type A sorting domain-containing protein, partial [Tenacibaculum sp. MEBiC06402]